LKIRGVNQSQEESIADVTGRPERWKFLPIRRQIEVYRERFHLPALSGTGQHELELKDAVQACLLYAHSWRIAGRNPADSINMLRAEGRDAEKRPAFQQLLSTPPVFAGVEATLKPMQQDICG